MARLINVKPLQDFVNKHGIQQTVYLLKEMCQETADESKIMKGKTSDFWTNAAIALYEAHEKITN